VSTPDRVNLSISSSSITLIWGSILLVYNMSDCFYILIYFIYERFNFIRSQGDRPVAPEGGLKVAHGSASLMVPLRSWFRFAHGSASLMVPLRSWFRLEAFTV
jgi:hypothetical protein